MSFGKECVDFERVTADAAPDRVSREGDGLGWVAAGVAVLGLLPAEDADAVFDRARELGVEGGSVIPFRPRGGGIFREVFDEASEPLPGESWGSYVAREVDPYEQKIDLQRVTPFAYEPAEASDSPRSAPACSCAMANRRLA